MLKHFQMSRLTEPVPSVLLVYLRPTASSAYTILWSLLTQGSWVVKVPRWEVLGDLVPVSDLPSPSRETLGKAP